MFHSFRYGSFWIREVGDIKIFCRFFKLRVRKLSLVGFLCCFINFNLEKNWITEEGDIKFCPRIFFYLTVPNISIGGNPLVFL